MTSGEATPAAEHRTVARVMSILELVLSSERDGMRLADLSLAIDAPKSTVHGLAKGLVATGYFREERGRYFVGPAISSLIAAGPMIPSSVYHHALEELAGKWNETAMLATLVGDSVVYIDSVEPDVFIRAAPQLNKRLPIWPRSAGKCFLAFMEPKRLEAYLRRNCPDPDEAKRVRAELEQVRETRIGVNVGESIEGHIGIASPIFRGQTPPTLALVVSGLAFRMQDHVEEIARSVRDAVDALSSTSKVD
jgi:DNA-binding IclR family transcriptional regulator